MNTREDIATLYGSAYADLGRLASGMWPTLAILSVLYLVAAAGWFAAPLLVATPLGLIVLRMLLFIGIAWLAAPFYVALHRFVAFGEVRWFPWHRDAGAPTAIYSGWAGVTVALWFAPLVAAEIYATFGMSISGVVCAGLGLVTVWVLRVRLTTLLPMAALAPDRASLARALTHTRHRFWATTFAVHGPTLPAWAALMIVCQAAQLRTIDALPWMALACSALLAVQLVPLIVGTRLYQRYSAAEARLPVPKRDSM
jgi:hypothetical protein